MALFSRRPTAQPAATSEAPPVVSVQDLADAQALMNQWDASLGNSDATWAVIEMIARKGGFQGSQAALMEVMNGKAADVVTTRPWRWWAEASRVASTQGNHRLIGQIFLFAHLFVNQTLPLMRPVDEMETGLGKPDDTSYWTIARNAAEALAQLPQNMLIHDTATGKVDVANARRLARIAANLPEHEETHEAPTQGNALAAGDRQTSGVPANAATLPPPDNRPNRPGPIPAQPATSESPTYQCQNPRCSRQGQALATRQCPECFHYAQAR